MLGPDRGIRGTPRDSPCNALNLVLTCMVGLLAIMMRNEDEEWTLFLNLSDNSAHCASASRKQIAPKAPKVEGLFEMGKPSNSVNPEIANLL